MSTIIPGKCRHCGCTENAPCRLPNNDECCWVDRTMLVCNNPACIMAEAARKRAERVAPPEKPKSQYAGMGYGLVIETKRREARRRGRRRKERAA